MLQFLGIRCTKALDPAALRIDTPEHMSNDSIFSSGIHSLENHQNGAASRREKPILSLLQALDVLLECLYAIGFLDEFIPCMGWDL